MHACVCVCVFMYACMYYAFVCVYTHMHAYIHTYIHRYIHRCMHTYIYVCMYVGVSLLKHGFILFYIIIFFPYSEKALKSGSGIDASNWINSGPVHSEVESKLQNLLIELGQQNKILGIQVYHFTCKHLIELWFQIVV